MPLLDQINSAFSSMLESYPSGIGNTSTSKYNDIKKIFSDALGLDVSDIYATGATSRVSNFDTRLAQGNQRNQRTSLGLAFLKQNSDGFDREQVIAKSRTSSSSTCTKFVSGEERGTQYDNLLVLLQIDDEHTLTPILLISSPDSPISSELQSLLPGVTLSVVRAEQNTHQYQSQTNRLDLISPLSNELVSAAHKDLSDAGLIFGEQILLRFVASLLAKRFVILTGLSGSGKTKLAHAFASWLSATTASDDPFLVGAKIQSDRISYIVRRSDHISVEFSNDEDGSKETLVVLPRALIQEWASHIATNNLTRDEPARKIREAVSESSKYSPQLNSFETHLKAAAFALLEAENIHNDNLYYRVVAVGADWTTNENILGYQDALQPDTYRKPSCGALDIILRADREMKMAKAGGSQPLPYFLILDEMNLSHVERYFADILSAIESGQEIALHSASVDLAASKDDRLPVPQRIGLPPNLYIIGTVNVDETTYMFSPKVLDRANVLEFRISADDIALFIDAPSKVDMASLTGKGIRYGKSLVAESGGEARLDDDTAVKLKERLTEVFDALGAIGAEFGFRTAYEITRFVHFHRKLAAEGWRFEDALDAQVLQKLMPKLHGSERKIGPVLDALDAFCEKYGCENSRAKIKRMQDRLKADGFTSFAEA